MYSIKGRRDSMEDESGIYEFKTSSGELVRVYAVWDGHGGKEVATLVSQQFPTILRQALADAKTFERLEIRPLLEAAHEKMHSHIPTKFQEVGCTSCVVIYVPGKNRLFCSNIGDSRSVLYLGNSIVEEPMNILPLSIDHKPDESFESSRLGKLGATVHDAKGEKGTSRVWYANTGLSMSRAFGDLAGMPFISHAPDFCMVKLRRGDVGLCVLACDGLWDVYSNKAAWDAIKNEAISSDLEISKRLVRSAYEKGSTDNISVVCFPVEFN